jgi:hypothetical protein
VWWISHMSKFHLVSASGTNATLIKALRGVITDYAIFNNAGYPVFVKFHDVAVVPTPGANVMRTIGVQSGQPSEDNDYIEFENGIAMTIVKGITDSDATPIAAGDIVVDFTYT